MQRKQITVPHSHLGYYIPRGDSDQNFSFVNEKPRGVKDCSIEEAIASIEEMLNRRAGQTSSKAA